MSVERMHSEIDVRSGDAIEHIKLSDNQFDELTIRKTTDNNVIVKAQTDDETTTFTFDVRGEAVTPLVQEGTWLPTQLRSALFNAGYAVEPQTLERIRHD